MLAYRTLRLIDERVAGPGGQLQEAMDIVRGLSRFEQHKKGFGAQREVRRILETLVETGIDYFSANPRAMGQDSTSRRIVHSFVQQLDETDLVEGSRREIIGDLLGSALRTFEVNVPSIEDDEQIQAILGGVVKSLIADVDAFTQSEVSEQVLAGREMLLKNFSSSLLRGAVGAFSENISLSVGKNPWSKTIVQSTLTQVLEGIKGQEDLFTNASIELIYKSALNAIGENPEVLMGNGFLENLIANTINSLINGDSLYSKGLVGSITQAALEIVRERGELLIDPDSPDKQFLADTISAIAGRLPKTPSGGEAATKLLSKRHLLDLTKTLLGKVATNPEQLIGANTDDPRLTTISQVVGSVAGALGNDASLLVTGDGFVDLIEVAISEAGFNLDKLIDFSSATTTNNLLHKILREIVVASVNPEGDPRKLITRDVFFEVCRRILPLASKNLELLVFENSQLFLIQDTIGKVLELASGDLEDRINGANIPALIEGLLNKVLWNELKLTERESVFREAKAILRKSA